MDLVYRYSTRPVSVDHLQPGDIVLIASSNDRITHGDLFVRRINESEFAFFNPLSCVETVAVETLPIDGEKRGQWYVGAGRLVVSEEGIS